MKRKSNLSLMLPLVFPFLAGPTDRTPYPWEIKEKEKPNPRPDEVNELSKVQKKIYCKVLKETQDRELAMKAALKIKRYEE